MKVINGFQASDEIRLTLKDLFLLLIGRTLKGGAKNISVWKKMPNKVY